VTNWRIKPIDQLLAAKDRHSHRMPRTLDALDLTNLGVGAIIGTGIFVLTGVAAANYAGPAVVLSFVLAGIASGMAAFIYAEMATAVPVAGSAYTYTYVSMGEMLAWLVGWNLALEYLVASGAVAIGWSSYFVDLLQSAGISLPTALTTSPLSGGIVNLPAAFIVLAITALIIIGTQHSSTANKYIVAAKLAAIILFIAAGVRHIDPANWQPFLPFGVPGIMHGAAIVFFAYIGFDAVSTAAEEVKNPRRDLPIGIIASLLVATVLYLLVSLVLTAVVPYTELDTASPVATAMLRLGLPWVAALISVGALAGLTSVLLVTLYGQSRIFFAMARDGLLPPIFEWVHPRLQTPLWDSIIIGILVAAAGALLPIGVVAEMANIGTLSAFTAVSVSLLILRKKRPDLPRPFRIPWVPWFPILSIGASVYLAANLPTVTWIRFAAWIILGLVLYFLYGRKHSLLAVSREKTAPRGEVLPTPAHKKTPGPDEKERFSKSPAQRSD
jgi:APA family basic amino acid/polyamine antiporter